MPQPFTTASPVVASFDYSDIAEGTGTNDYYLFSTLDDTAIDYHISKDQTKRSSNIEYSQTVGSGGSNSADYDLSIFNLPQTIEGTAYISGSAGIEYVSGATPNKTLVITCKIRKWDGTTETEIASNSSTTFVGVANSNPVYFNYLFPITIPNTFFAKGETLRVSIDTLWTADGGGAWTYHYGTDPTNRDGSFLTATADTTTITKVSIPFDLNL